jgi:RNA polymerase sigma-70 factor, ECF subfamily
VASLPEEHTSWTKAVGGDSYGFAAVFDRHRDRVYRHALQLTGNVHDAEDVTAGAFFELWRRRKSVRVVDGTVLPWLLVTTTNLAHNRARGLRRYRALIDALPRSDDARGAGDLALEHIGEVVVAEQVKEALNSLAKSDAALITLTGFEHYSPAEAATALGISEGAARTRLHRARARMASALEASRAGEREEKTKEMFR